MKGTMSRGVVPTSTFSTWTIFVCKQISIYCCMKCEFLLRACHSYIFKDENWLNCKIND